MKIIHRADIDYVSIDFKDEIEAKSIYENGIIVRMGLRRSGGVATSLRLSGAPEAEALVRVSEV